ncbi:bifunctional riboflavin kinase/FAD synthetase [Geobacter sp. AOG1]|uniref:bifunctional riboflavin kinase/FAD synthetase n=1 Tax=Geobacter sp. AOG1 TaxID=1566346 RepID=UPI001CC57B21|nr:bifunctional riboflavin kinase/FAD synthetase [Geobacter sp. AOG1]GFE58452.1 riboflavin biosynthesis protein [Geobacter sp. AOG1]
MIIYRSIDEIRERLPNAVVTIGNFDGVHLGHREMFRRLKKAAADIGGVSVVITFYPHPLKVLPVGRDVRLINTYAEKENLIEASGVDYLVVLHFTPEFASISATEFVRDILVGRIGARKLIIGYDYAFGRNRQGDVAFLQRLGGEMGFAVEVLAPIGTGETVYSSSMVRRLIQAGDVKEVVAFLGRHFSVGGTVVHGHHRGKDLGFPTANLQTDKELLPAHGVYAVKVKVNDRIYDGACNIGDNPTFGDEASAIEVFLFDFDGDLYGNELRVYFVERLRGEMKFPDVASLTQAIGEDIRRCREILRDVSIIEYRDYLGALDHG